MTCSISALVYFIPTILVVYTKTYCSNGVGQHEHHCSIYQRLKTPLKCCLKKCIKKHTTTINKTHKHKHNDGKLKINDKSNSLCYGQGCGLNCMITAVVWTRILFSINPGYQTLGCAIVPFQFTMAFFIYHVFISFFSMSCVSDICMFIRYTLLFVVWWKEK